MFVYVDNVCGKAEEVHNPNVSQLMRVLRKYHSTLNQDKSLLLTNTITLKIYFCHNDLKKY